MPEDEVGGVFFEQEDVEGIVFALQTVTAHIVRALDIHVQTIPPITFPIAHKFAVLKEENLGSTVRSFFFKNTPAGSSCRHSAADLFRPSLDRQIHRLFISTEIKFSQLNGLLVILYGLVLYFCYRNLIHFLKCL